MSPTKKELGNLIESEQKALTKLEAEQSLVKDRLSKYEEQMAFLLSPYALGDTVYFNDSPNEYGGSPYNLIVGKINRIYRSKGYKCCIEIVDNSCQQVWHTKANGEYPVKMYEHSIYRTREEAIDEARRLALKEVKIYYNVDL